MPLFITELAMYRCTVFFVFKEEKLRFQIRLIIYQKGKGKGEGKGKEKSTVISIDFFYYLDFDFVEQNF